MALLRGSQFEGKRTDRRVLPYRFPFWRSFDGGFGKLVD